MYEFTTITEVAMSGNSIYTESEQLLLDRVKQVRIDIIEEMTKDGVPSRGGDIRVLNEVLTSTDKMLADTASIRVKQEDVNNNGAGAELVAELLKQARANKQHYLETGTIPELPSALAAVEVVSGEMDISPEPLVASEFVAPAFDPSKL